MSVIHFLSSDSYVCLVYYCVCSRRLSCYVFAARRFWFAKDYLFSRIRFGRFGSNFSRHFVHSYGSSNAS